MPARGLRLAAMVLGLLVLGAVRPAAGEDVLRPPRAGASTDCVPLGDLGVRALERLPWDVRILRANLSAERPVAVAALYLMEADLLVVSQTGFVYCMSRRDLTPRWVTALKAPLAALPAEGPTHYTFLVKAADGKYWVQALDRRSGADTAGFPVPLGFAASSGVANDTARVWIGSLGSPRDNRTLESVSLADGRPGWGWRTRGLLWASPVCVPGAGTVILAGEDGTVLSLATGGSQPTAPNWSVGVTGQVTATPVVTPEHVVVGSNDGTLRCLDLGSGEVKWLEGLDAPIRTSPWVIGSRTRSTRPSGVEGAADVEVESFTGIVFARNQNGLFALDLVTGARLFDDPSGRRPICRAGPWVLVMDGSRTVALHDARDGYKVMPACRSACSTSSRRTRPTARSSPARTTGSWWPPSPVPDEPSDDPRWGRKTPGPGAFPDGIRRRRLGRPSALIPWAFPRGRAAMSALPPLLAAGVPGGWELWIILLIVLVLFGKRIPQVARSLGQGISQFKKGLSEANELPDGDDEGKARAKEAPKTPEAPPPSGA